MSKPLNPPIIYHDGQNIYLEWTGYAQRFPLTEGGLSKALKSIPHIASSPGYVTGRSNIADKLLDTRKAKISTKTSRERQTAKATEGMRRSASDAIRKMRLKGSQ